MLVVLTPNHNRRKVMLEYSTPRLDALCAADGFVVEVDSVLDMLRALSDSRKARGKVYALPTILLLMLLAKLSGEDSQRGIAQWLAERRDALTTWLALPTARTPSRETLRRIVSEVVSAEQLEKRFAKFLASLTQSGTPLIVSLDGKTLRGSVSLTRPRGLHLLAAYLPAQGMVLFQMPVERKENEIPVAQRLLKHLVFIATEYVARKVVTGDALLTQRQLCLQIIAAGGDYVCKVKQNQPQLHEDIRLLFTKLPPKPDFETVATVEGTHGRIDQRTLTLSSLLQSYSDWPHLAQVFQVVRRVTDPHTGVTTEETSYGVTSLQRRRVTPQQLLCTQRAHWGIENGLHYRRDVTFREDFSRVRTKCAPQVMAALNNFVLSLLAWLGYDNAPKARRHFAAHLDQALSLLTRSLS
jgi:predicted transposase YbfD/YdcC